MLVFSFPSLPCYELLCFSQVLALLSHRPFLLFFFCIFALRLLDLSPSHHVHHEQFFLLRDERLKIDGPVTKVPFPKGCRKLRVYSYAWFEKEKEWRVIRDKVCTWGRRKKTYTLMVTNQMVESFQLLSAGGLE